MNKHTMATFQQQIWDPGDVPSGLTAVDLEDVIKDTKERGAERGVPYL